jgi:hypothetical protein
MKTLITTLSLLTISLSTLAMAQPAPAGKQPPPSPPAVMPPMPPLSAPACFELSPDGKAWSRTPELLCVGSGDKNVAITLKTGMPPNIAEVAVFHLDLTARVRCIDCNKDVFSLSNPTNSVFNALKISFDGKRDVKAGTETGAVSIGKTKFRYRAVK